MIHLPESCAAWGTPAFAEVLARELAAARAELPLLHAMAHGNAIADEPITVSVRHAAAANEELRLRVSVFFASLIAGCSCADDPTPIDTLHEYCELDVTVARCSGEARIALRLDEAIEL